MGWPEHLVRFQTFRENFAASKEDKHEQGALLLSLVPKRLLRGSIYQGARLILSRSTYLAQGLLAATMKKLSYGLLALCAIYALLLIPPRSPEAPEFKPSEQPFVWGQNELWQLLEEGFQVARTLEQAQLARLVSAKTKSAEQVLRDYESSVRSPDDPIYAKLESNFFEAAPLIAAMSDRTDWHLRFYERFRTKMKNDSTTWDLSMKSSRDAIYRSLYGMRAAVEEIELQRGSDLMRSTLKVKDEPSATPATEILGIRVHSGDLLVSRGGSEMSAFIARANDYPGNFSHVAIIYVEPGTNIPYIVEAHIDKGVTVADTSAYLEDTKLRFMVLRPRADLSAIDANPMLGHEAARFVLNEARQRHIPYDFSMDYFDSSRMFCSEVGSYAYREFGISLWEPKSTVSSEGVVSWLMAFGVENFFTQLPADLEYDPSLSVVAEWRNRETLAQDHVDNAVMDALIARANEGEELDYNIWMLPVVRVLKAYSVVLNWTGRVAIVPEGMSPLTVLKNEEFKSRFRETRRHTMQMAADFEEEMGYPPPYWELVDMANGF